VDALITNRVWTAMGLNPSSSLHDVRWGSPWGDDFVWIMEISGSVPPSHLRGGYAGTVSERQSPMYFALGGGTIKGVSKPGRYLQQLAHHAPGHAGGDARPVHGPP
jgi:hypothetical protein